MFYHSEQTKHQLLGSRLKQWNFLTKGVTGTGSKTYKRITHWRLTKCTEIQINNYWKNCNLNVPLGNEDVSIIHLRSV
jgi:hypothetical protein